MSTYLRAAVLREVGKNLSVERLKFNRLSRGQVLVRNIYSGVCRSQLMEQQGKRGSDKWLPHLLGHEGFGVVEEIGEGVTKCLPGDKVILSWVEGAGINATNPVYIDSKSEKVNSGKVTTFSSFSVVSENRIFLAPSGYSERLLPLFGCALLTGGGMALKYGENAKVESVCVIGFGGIGSAASLVLKGMGHKSIDVVENSLEKREQAFNLGFTNVFQDISEISENYDLVIEASGTKDGIESGFESLNTKGTLVFASHPETGSRISLDPHELIKGKQIYGTWGGDVNPDESMVRIGEFISKTGANLELLVGETFYIEQVNEALAYLDSGKTGRPILKLNEE
jgi:S-(hydroxymethyl)glutathione dehydrogenase / alcohol dehydrogenase